MKLLIVSCTARKSSGEALLPALLRYRGPAYFVIRKWLREQTTAGRKAATEPLRIWILSAKFGLIEADELIPDYDLKLTINGVVEMQPLIAEQAARLHRKHFNMNQPQRVFCYLSTMYMAALNNYLSELATRRVLLERVVGPPGVKLRQLKNWLAT